MNTELAYDLLVTKTLHPGSIVMVFAGANGAVYRLNSEQEGYNYQILAGYGSQTGSPDDRILKMTNKINGRIIYYNLSAIESIDIMPAPVLFTPASLTMNKTTGINVTVVFHRKVKEFPKEAIMLTNGKVTSAPINLDSGVGLSWRFGVAGTTTSTNNVLKINLEKIIYDIPGGSWTFKNDTGMKRETRYQPLYAECTSKFTMT